MSISRKKVSTILFYIGVLLPPVVMLCLIYRFGVNVPFGDDWEFTRLILKFHNSSLSFADFWVQHNEHRPVSLKIITLALARVSCYNLRVEMYCGFAFQCLSLVFLWKILQLTLRDRFAVLIRPLTILSSLFLFSAAQSENWIWGVGSLAWGLTVLCAIVAVWALVRWPGRWIAILVAFFAALIGTFTLANGMMLWIIGLLGIVAYSIYGERKFRWRYIIFWISLATTSIILNLADFKDPGNHDPFFFAHHPLDFISYILVYVGSPLTFISGYELPLALGLAGILTLAILVYLIARNIPAMKKEIIPWLLLPTYVVTSAAMTALGRALYGPEQASAIRYRSLALLFWISLFVIIALALGQRIQQGHSRLRFFDGVIAALISIFLIVAYIRSYAKGYSEIESTSLTRTYALGYLDRYETAPDAGLEILYPNAASVRELAASLKAARLGPFSNSKVPNHTLEP